ncbi:phenylalanine--tRNA ligase subunit alpha [Candidatus Jidaibacter acanthamoebae]|nr:phenylalanine--tRNA ligase subunit alpha [Candidatus Jidaibacter acanthamoeba]
MKSTEEIKQYFIDKVASAPDLAQLEQIRIEFLGKKGHITEALSLISKVNPEERKAYGERINTLKNYIIEELEHIKVKLEAEFLEAKLLAEKIDITLSPRNYSVGKEHPITKVITELKSIFSKLGFDYAEGPDIENDWNNFTALNIPEHHPARQMHDTFYLKEDKLLLRTHTSPVQIRHMTKHKPPIKIISIGKVYRSDYDATHTPMFHQIEALYVDKNINMVHLKSYLEMFLKLFFEVENAPVRLRPNHFPFTEPSAEVDVKCDRSSKQEIKIGMGNDWLEILGCGMVNPKVLENVGLDPSEYQGFAFGAGVERLAMLKYNIPDLRTFFEGDIRWLKHYGF